MDGEGNETSNCANYGQCDAIFGKVLSAFVSDQSCY